MKTVTDVKAEISEIKIANNGRRGSSDRTDKLLYKNAQKKIKELYEVQLYLETSPRPEFVEGQIQEQNDKLERINEEYSRWCKTRPATTDVRNLRKSFDKEMGVADIRKKIKKLKSIMK